jgi:hypothetical protein
MASITGSQYDVYAGGQTINFGITSDPNNVPPPVGGDFNLEVVVNATGTGSYNTASGYQGLAILSTDGHTLTLLHGAYWVIDDGANGGGNDHIYLGDGAESVTGASGDTLTGGTGNNQFIDATLGAETVYGGTGGSETIWGGAQTSIQGGSGGNETIVGAAGTTITGGSGGDEFINGYKGGQTITGCSGGNETIWGSSSGNPADTIHGGTGGNETIAGGAGDSITGGSGGDEFINGYGGGQSITGGSGGNETIWGSSSGNPADTIQGGAGNETIVGGTGDTITGGSGNEFINAYLGGESISGGSGNETIWGSESGQPGNTIQGAAAGGSATIAFSATHNAETLWDDGTASGNDTVYNYNTAGGDNFSMASGETISSSNVVGGNVVVTLSDGSTITFAGTTDVAGIVGSFHNH